MEIFRINNSKVLYDLHENVHSVLKINNNNVGLCLEFFFLIIIYDTAQYRHTRSSDPLMIL